MGVGEILLREGGERESADEKWQDQRASQKSHMSPHHVGCLGRREFNSFDLLNPPKVATPSKSKPRRTQQSWLVSCFSARLGIRGVPLFDYFLDYNYGRFLLKERKLQERKVQLDRAVSLTPETRPVYHERGKLNVILGDYQQARRDAEQASHLQDPSGFVLDFQVYYLLATV